MYALSVVLHSPASQAKGSQKTLPVGLVVLIQDRTYGILQKTREIIENPIFASRVVCELISTRLQCFEFNPAISIDIIFLIDLAIGQPPFTLGET